MSNNCKCQCNKTLKNEIKRLKGIITGMKKVIMLLKRQINTIIRLKTAEKTLKGRLKTTNEHIEEESDEDIIYSDTSSNEDNENIESTTLKLSLDQ